MLCPRLVPAGFMLACLAFGLTGCEEPVKPAVKKDAASSDVTKDGVAPDKSPPVEPKPADASPAETKAAIEDQPPCAPRC